MELIRRPGTSKTSVWRWQERFLAEGARGLLRDKTRPPRNPLLGLGVAARVVAATRSKAPGETTHRTGARWPNTSASASVRCSASGASTGASRTQAVCSSCRNATEAAVPKDNAIHAIVDDHYILPGHPQASEGRGVAGAAPAVARKLHADAVILAEHGRGVC
jgi:hypothetical protein